MQDTVYRCKKCRRLVATGDNVVKVPAGGSRQRPFSWGFKPQELSSAQSHCSVGVIENIGTSTQETLNCP